MNILFIHQNFPGQFVHLSAALAADVKHRVVALSIYQQTVPQGVILRTYSLLRPPAEEAHPLVRDFESKVLRGEACAAAALQLQREGFVPDIVIVHSGWGEALFIKDIFPRVKLVVFCEYYYASEGQDVGFDPDMPPLTFDQKFQLRLRNAQILLSISTADIAYAPTQWQRSTYPAWIQKKIEVVHDGIDIERLVHRPKTKISLAATADRPEVNLKYGDEIVTFVSRNLEPVRGFQVFMRMLPKLQILCPNAHVLIVGGEGVSYGQQAPNSSSWKQHLLDELDGQLDLSRVHFCGRVPDNIFVDLLHISAVHTYWTTPFVLSWSFLEAATAGVPVVASDTAPVREFAKDFEVALIEFFDSTQFAVTIAEKLEGRGGTRRMKKLSSISRVNCVKRQIEMFGIN